KGEAPRARQLMRVNGAGRVSREAGRLPDIGHNFVESVAMSSDHKPKHKKNATTMAASFRPGSLMSCFCLSFRHESVLRQRSQNLAANTLLENIQAKISHTHLREDFRFRIEDWNFGGILRDGFLAGKRIAVQAERALRPAQHIELPARAPPEKEVDFLADAEFRRTLDTRVKVLVRSARLAHHDLRR